MCASGWWYGAVFDKRIASATTGGRTGRGPPMRFETGQADLNFASTATVRRVASSDQSHRSARSGLVQACSIHTRSIEQIEMLSASKQSSSRRRRTIGHQQLHALRGQDLTGFEPSKIGGVRRIIVLARKQHLCFRDSELVAATQIRLPIRALEVAGYSADRKFCIEEYGSFRARHIQRVAIRHTVFADLKRLTRRLPSLISTRFIPANSIMRSSSTLRCPRDEWRRLASPRHLQSPPRGSR
jgi:hypothetical protein